MSRIVLDARESGTTSGRYIDKLIEHLAKLPTEHEFIALCKTPRIDYIKSVAPTFRIEVCDVKEFTFAEQTKLKHQINSLKPDLVHFPMVQQPVWYHGKVVTTMNDLTTVRFRNPTKNQFIYACKQRVYVWVNKRVARKSQHLLTFTDYVRDDVIAFTGVSADKFTTTYLAADPITVPAEAVNSLDGSQFVMYVGRPYPHKNLERLIEAFALLKKDHPKLKLVLAGKKDQQFQYHEGRVKAAGIKDVVFTDFVTEGQLRWLLGHAAAYVFPSLSEGFGLPGLEAMLCGAPVVSSNATCLPEVYQDGALYFDPLDVSDIAAKVGQVIEDAALQKELRTKGVAVVKKYSWEKTANQTLAVYNQVLKG